MLCPCVQIARPCLSKFKMTIIRNRSFVSVIKRTPWSFVLQVSHQCLFKRREFSASHARLYIKRSSSLTDGPLFLSSRTSRSLSPFVRPRFVFHCVALCCIVRRRSCSTRSRASPSVMKCASSWMLPAFFKRSLKNRVAGVNLPEWPFKSSARSGALSGSRGRKKAHVDKRKQHLIANKSEGDKPTSSNTWVALQSLFTSHCYCFISPSLSFYIELTDGSVWRSRLKLFANEKSIKA